MPDDEKRLAEERRLATIRKRRYASAQSAERQARRVANELAMPVRAILTAYDDWRIDTADRPIGPYEGSVYTAYPRG